MLVTFTCPQCQRNVTAQPSAEVLICPACALRIDAPSPAQAPNRIERCLVCPSRDLYVRKDFPQRWGVAIAVTGFGASLIAWNYYWVYTTFGILFATALADLALFQFMGSVLVCYGCGAHYRNVQDLDSHPAFHLETHERHRQQAARLSQHSSAAPDALRQ